jgi:hypothetical protein
MCLRSPALKQIIPLASMAITIDAVASVVNQPMFAGIPVVVALSPVVLVCLWSRVAAIMFWRSRSVGDKRP